MESIKTLKNQVSSPSWGSRTPPSGSRPRSNPSRTHTTPQVRTSTYHSYQSKTPTIFSNFSGHSRDRGPATGHPRIRQGPIHGLRGQTQDQSASLQGESAFKPSTLARISVNRLLRIPRSRNAQCDVATASSCGCARRSRLP